MAPADQRCVQMDLLPVVIYLCSPALASSCNFDIDDIDEVAPQSSAALHVMGLGMLWFQSPCFLLRSVLSSAAF